MGATWGKDDFVEGGIKSITGFDGVLVGIDEDLEGKFGTQMRLNFEQVDNVDSDTPILLEDGTLQAYIKQSEKKNTTNAKMVDDFESFAGAHKLGAIPGSLCNAKLRWERTTYEFGEDEKGELMTSSVFIPVKVLGGGSTKAVKTGPAKRGRPRKVVEAQVEETVGEPEDTDDPLTKAVISTVGDDGSTKSLITRELSRKSTLRTLLAKAGGIDKLLKTMTANGVLIEDDGYYVLA